MSYNNSNTTAENSKNSANNSTDNDSKEDNNSALNTSYKFNICKIDAKNNQVIFQKTINDINEAVAECCKCNSIDESIQPPHFENTAEDGNKAALWLSKNNSNYNFIIEQANQHNACNEKNTSISDKIAHEKGILLNANVADTSISQDDIIGNGGSSNDENANQTESTCNTNYKDKNHDNKNNHPNKVNQPNYDSSEVNS